MDKSVFNFAGKVAQKWKSVVRENQGRSTKPVLWGISLGVSGQGTRDTSVILTNEISGLVFWEGSHLTCA